MKKYSTSIMCCVFVILCAILGAQTRPSALDIKDKNYVDVREFGVKGDGITDDTQKIQAAIDYILETPTAPTTLYFPPAGSALGSTYYKTTAPLVIESKNGGGSRQRQIHLMGSGPLDSKIVYRGTSYEDVIVASGTINSFEMSNLMIAGGGYARYCLSGKFTRFTNIDRCYFTEAAGFINMEDIYYGSITNNHFYTSIASYPSSIDTSDVHGVNSALIVLSAIGRVAGSNIVFSHNAIAACGMKAGVGTTAHVLLVRGAGVIDNNTFETIRNRPSDSADVRSVDHLIFAEGVYNISNSNIETLDTNVSLLKVRGTGTGVVMSNTTGYSVKSGVFVANYSGSDIHVRDSKLDNIFLTNLFIASSTVSAAPTNVYFDNVKLVPGTINTTTTPPESDMGAVSTNANKWQGGIADGATTLQRLDYNVIPNVLSGYAVATSTDHIGLCVTVSAGKFLHSSGKVVDSYWGAEGAAAPVQKLRFLGESARRLKYHQIKVNRLGNAYMTVTNYPILTFNGDLPFRADNLNCLAEFYVDGADGIASITVNPRLSFSGSFSGQNRERMIMFTSAAAGPPGTIPVATGTICYFTPDSPLASFTYMGAVAVTGGYPVTWKKFGALEP